MRISNKEDGSVDFYFEVNESKMHSEDAFKEQLNNVISFLIKRYKLASGFIDITSGQLRNDQILNNTFTLRLTFQEGFQVKNP